MRRAGRRGRSPARKRSEAGDAERPQVVADVLLDVRAEHRRSRRAGGAPASRADHAAATRRSPATTTRAPGAERRRSAASIPGRSRSISARAAGLREPLGPGGRDQTGSSSPHLLGTSRWTRIPRSRPSAERRLPAAWAWGAVPPAPGRGRRPGPRGGGSRPGAKIGAGGLAQERDVEERGDRRHVGDRRRGPGRGPRGPSRPRGSNQSSRVAQTIAYSS